MSLLDDASKHNKKQRTGVNITKQHIELALAWAEDEISLASVTSALKSKNTGGMQAYVTLARALKEAYKRGILHRAESSSDDE